MRLNKKGFTLIEVLIVLIILSLLSVLSTMALSQMAKNYRLNRNVSILNYQTGLALSQLKRLLMHRVKNSVIVDKCTLNDDGCDKGNVTSFKSIANLKENETLEYPVIEWLNIDKRGFLGNWNNTKNQNIYGFSYFIDLAKTIGNSTTGHTIISPESDFSVENDINNKLLKNLVLKNLFTEKKIVMLFAGSSGRGDISSIDNSYGYFTNLTGSNNKTKIWQINSYYVNNSPLYTQANISLLTPDGNTEPYEMYWLLNTAYALVPKKNSNGLYDIYLRYFYYPWKDETYKDGQKALFLKNVSSFTFKMDELGVLHLYLCLSDPSIVLKNGKILTVCKEGVIQ